MATLASERPLTQTQIREGLDIALSSDTFHSSPKLRQYLKFIVETALTEDETALTLSSLVVELEGAKNLAEVNAKEDIVKQNVRRLRKKLALYYECEEGQKNELYITLPPRTYVPTFMPNNRENLPPRSIEASDYSKQIDRHHRWWSPLLPDLELASPEEWLRHHNQTSATISRLVLLLIGFSLFCGFALGIPDKSLIIQGATIQLPFVGTRINLSIFLTIATLLLFTITVSLHVFVSHWLRLNRHAWSIQFRDSTLPFLINLKHSGAQIFHTFLLYWFTPVVLLIFAWKVSPLRMAWWLGLAAVLIFEWMIILKIQRKPMKRARIVEAGLWGLLLFIPGWSMVYGLPETPLEFYRIDLRNADLRSTVLAGADFREAHLESANLFSVDLNHANLSHANLSGSVLTFANMEKATLYRTNLTSASITRPNLYGANLFGADFDHATMDRAVLDSTNLQQANLTHTNLILATLKGADLRQADLTNAILFQADLTGAILDSTDFSYTDLSATKGLTAAQLLKTRSLFGTKLDKTLRDEIAEKRPALLGL